MPSILDQAYTIRDAMDRVASQIPDSQAAAVAALYPIWEPGHAYKTGERVRYGSLYKVLQDHTSQADWTPDTAVSLYVRIADPAEEWPAWAQPTGAHDAYSKGDGVSHRGKHWTSDVDNNTWEPGVYGWTEVA